MGNDTDLDGGLAPQTGAAATVLTALRSSTAVSEDDDPCDIGNPNLADTPRKAAEHGFLFEHGMLPDPSGKLT